MKTINVDNLTLPDGSIYTGECIKNCSMVELKGNGEIYYPNGDKYIGEFEGGNVRGYGKYIFKDGDIHYGWFYDGIPTGIGYLNRHSTMCMGTFKEGLLNGWALRMGERAPIFGWWEKGTLIRNETTNIEWVFGKIQNSNFNGNWARIFQNRIFGLGIPQENYNSYHIPYFGFLFYMDKSVAIGQASNFKKSGHCAFFKADESVEYAEYHDDILTKKSTSYDVRIAHLVGYPVY
jgi:hypothetical protein